MPSSWASFFSAFGANHRDASHCFTSCWAALFGTFAGRTPSGAISGSAAFGCATIGAPQKRQTPAVSGGSKVRTLPQPEQVTSTALSPCGAVSTAASVMGCDGTVVACDAGGASTCPQKRHFSAPDSGSNSIPPEQLGQRNWSGLVGSGIVSALQRTAHAAVRRRRGDYSSTCGSSMVTPICAEAYTDVVVIR